MKTIITITIGLILILISCTDKKTEVVNYVNGKQVLSMNAVDRYGNQIEQPTLQVQFPDTINLGEKFVAKAFLSDQEYKIVDARFDCSVNDSSLVDTLRNRIIGCSKGLLVSNDTIEIHFKVGGKSGPREFHEITALSKDEEGIFRYHQGNFKYFVKE